MANLKQYAYFLKGNKIALVENDITPENDPTSRDYGPDARVRRYKSPVETVTDGLEIEYTYSPEFYWKSYLNKVISSINTDLTQTGDTGLRSNYFSNPSWDPGTTAGYYLQLYWRGSDQTALFPVNTYVYITGNPYFNGMHKVIVSSNAGGHTTVTFETPLKKVEHQSNNLTTANDHYQNEINQGTVYYGIKKMEDESFDLDLSPYLTKAIVYYLKAKMAEDKKDFKSKEYFMKEFKQLVEKKQSANIWGPRVIVPGAGSIR
tara:strand:+ start:689 stop:1474 length:786 start_codon:yes stop_codon:yes gene_type:complete